MIDTALSSGGHDDQYGDGNDQADTRRECGMTSMEPSYSRGSEKTETENSGVIVINNFRTRKIPPLVWREFF